MPCAAVASDSLAHALAQRLLAYDDQRLAQLRGVAGSNILVLLGVNEYLPWLPNMQYLGVIDEAPRLLLPTELEPNVPVALLQQALLQQPSQLAILPSSKQLIAVEHAQVIDKNHLQHWLSKCH